MKKLLLRAAFGAVTLGLLLPATVVSAQQRQAAPQNPPSDLWCRDQPIAEGSSATFCSAYTYQQCMASRASPTESCYLNPRYDARLYRR